jgi:diguanylate cyclase (GGDEF)-like protein
MRPRQTTIEKARDSLTAKSAGAIVLGRARRSWAMVFASLTLLILLGSLAAAIVYSQQQSRAQLRTNFALRATSSATLVSEFLKEQATLERPVAAKPFSKRHASSTRFELNAFVSHTIAYRPHDVLLVDGNGKILASSPKTSATTLAAADPKLAHAVAHSANGAIDSDRTATTFTTAGVPGTTWRLVVAVPNSHLYNSLTGWSSVIPWLVFALVTILGVLLVLLFARSIADRARLTRLSAAMERTAQTDSLTGLNNRRALTEQLTRVAARARRHDELLSVLMLDLDRFKQINDTFGHEAGDQVLCTVADCMREVLRAGDIYGRWGGDEFLVVLPLTDESGAKATAERLRTAACAVTLDTIGLPEGIPLSVGVASGAHTSPIELVREADSALYEDKADGRSKGRGQPHGDALAQH